MINDRDIDLTLEHKFSDGPNKFVFPRPKTVPWDEILSLDTAHPKRSYGDSLSDNFGATVRRDSKNHFTVFDKNYHYDKEVLEEFFMEEMGRIPGEAVQYCYRCGAKNIAHHMVIYCDKCETGIRADECYKRLFSKPSPNNLRGNYVPWMDFIVLREDDGSVKIYKPEHVLREIIKKY
jgi:hypothetical protein